MTTPDQTTPDQTVPDQTGPSGEPTDPRPELKDGLYGFVASTPQFSHREGGVPRLYFKAGQDHYLPGTFTKTHTTFHDVVAFKGAAVHGAEKLAKHDRFLAHGYLDTYPDKDTGEEKVRFVATRLGHDLARTDYEVDRTPHHGVGIDAPDQAPAQDAPQQAPRRQAPEFPSPPPQRQSDPAHAIGM